MSEPTRDEYYTTVAEASYSDVLLPTVDHSDFLQDHKAQHQLLAVLYDKLAEHRTSNHELFLTMDAQRCGFLAPPQFKAALENLGIPLTEQQLQWLMTSFDCSQEEDGIDYKEFLNMLSACRAGKVAAGPGAAAPAKTGLDWAPEAAAASPFKAADDAREARKRLVLQRYADMLHQAATASVVEAGVQTEEETTAAAAAPTEQTAVVQAMLLKLAQLAYTKLGGLKKGFAHADGDGDHLISRADLAHCLEHHLGLVLPSAEFDCLFSALDFDGTGSVHYYEWIRVLSHFADVTQAGAMPHNWSPAAATAALLAPAPAPASTPAAVPVAAGTMEAVVEGDETAGLGVMDTVRQDDDKVLCQAAEAVRERGLHAHELIAQLLPDSGGKADAGGLQALFAKLGVTGVDDARAQRLLARADLMGSGAIVAWELVRLLASATPKGE